MATPSFYEIAKYWKNKNITEYGEIFDTEDLNKYSDVKHIPVIKDFGEPRCFCCGAVNKRIYESESYKKYMPVDEKNLWNEKNNFEKAHIVPKDLGGKDDPSNLFILCKECHRESPDTVFERMFFQWIYSRRIYSKGMTILDDSIQMCKKNNIPLYYLLPNSTNNKYKNTHGAIFATSTISAEMVGLALTRKQIIEETFDNLINKAGTSLEESALIFNAFVAEKVAKDNPFSDERMETMLKFTQAWLDAFRRV